MDIAAACSMKNRPSYLAFAALLWSTAGFADAPRGVWFLGGDVSESSSVYGGSVISLPGQSLGHGWAIRTSAGAGRYRYDSAGTAITGKYVSGETALVYQSSGKWGWANFSAGPRFSHTYLSPYDPGNRLRGSRWDLGVQSDGALDDPRFRASWYGSYGLRNRTYDGKLQLALKSGDNMALGIEAGIHGDPTYRKETLGGLIRKSVGRQVTVELGAGIAAQHSRASRPYASVGLSRLF